MDLAGSERAGRTKATGDRPLKIIEIHLVSIRFDSFHSESFYVNSSLSHFKSRIQLVLECSSFQHLSDLIERLKEGAAINQSLSTLARP